MSKAIGELSIAGGKSQIFLGKTCFRHIRATFLISFHKNHMIDLDENFGKHLKILGEILIFKSWIREFRIVQKPAPIPLVSPNPEKESVRCLILEQ